MLQFESPLLFLALVPLVPYLAYCLRKSYADLPERRGRLALLLRFVALGLVVLALTKPILLLENREEGVLFLVDVSDSVPPEALDASLATIAAETKDLAASRSVGLVLFAGRPQLVVPPSRNQIALDDALRDRVFHRRERAKAEERLQALERSDLGAAEQDELAKLRARLAAIRKWEEEIGTQETDLEAACRLARGVMPEDRRRRLVLCSDGNATRGDVLREVSELKRGGFSVHTSLLRKSEKPEVIAESITLPSQVQVKAPFNAEVAIAASAATTGEVKVFRNKFLLATKALELKPGRNLVELPNLTLEEGFHEFEAVVSAKDDTVLENNVARGAVRVTGKPKVLLVDRDVPEARYLEEALTAAEIQVEVRPETGVPDEMNDLLNYDVLILSDVPATRLSPQQMDHIKRYVREMGGGLVMLGGEQSFGLGGYYRTPVEDALPVRMPIKKNVEKPNLALVLVIDKSGSMDGPKIQLAKEAAIAAADVLKDRDLFAVIAFDSLAQWICELTPASERETITRQIARLAAGGGTHIYPALYDAYKALLDADAKLKHIILLSDGVTQGSGYEELVSHIAADQITLSTVGIGSDVDEKLMKGLADGGGGEYYFTNDFSSIPQILTRETLRASKAMLVEEPFQPRLARPIDALKGVDIAGCPFLLGYVATQAKETATVALVSEYADPILAVWQYGLGKSAAFTSDAKSRWAGDWIGWPDFTKFWGQVVRAVMSTGTHHELQSQARVAMQQGRAQVTLDVRGRSGDFFDQVEPEISIVGDDATTRPLKTTHVAPGLFETEFPIEKYGDFYRLLVVQKQHDEILDVKALAVTESYSPEFKSPGPDEETLQLVARETGARYNPTAEDLWSFAGEPTRTPKDTWWWWLAIAALLLPVDIALRRLG